MALVESEDQQTAAILESLQGVDIPDERALADFMLATKVEAGSAVVDRVVLEAQDIPEGVAPVVKLMVGESFVRLGTGTWHGIGGNYGPATDLGRALENALARNQKVE